jgi:hypothetical protein
LNLEKADGTIECPFWQKSQRNKNPSSVAVKLQLDYSEIVACASVMLLKPPVDPEEDDEKRNGAQRQV